MPDFSRGQRLSIENVSVGERQTTPPSELSESDLISLMETHGIGTDASISVHIKNVIDRCYVSLNTQNRRLTPTQLGITLIHGYKRIDAELALPTMRANMEKQLDLIATGKRKVAITHCDNFAMTKSYSRVLLHFFSL